VKIVLYVFVEYRKYSSSLLNNIPLVRYYFIKPHRQHCSNHC